METVWPDWLCPSLFEAGIQSNVHIATSSLNGGVTTSQLPGWRWIHNVELAPSSSLDPLQARIEAFLATLEGQAGRLRMPHLKRPTPAGTMRGLPVCVDSPRGARSVEIIAQPGETLLPGDVVGLMTLSGEQRVMVTASQTVDSTITIQFSGPLRADTVRHSLVVWDRPMSTFILGSPVAMVGYGAGMNPGVALQLVEVFA